jgi:hypothetical protein
LEEEAGIAVSLLMIDAVGIRGPVSPDWLSKGYIELSFPITKALLEGLGMGLVVLDDGDV